MSTEPPASKAFTCTSFSESLRRCFTEMEIFIRAKNRPWSRWVIGNQLGTLLKKRSKEWRVRNMTWNDHCRDPIAARVRVGQEVASLGLRCRVFWIKEWGKTPDLNLFTCLLEAKLNGSGIDANLNLHCFIWSRFIILETWTIKANILWS
jgi:hypothetical protein